MSKSILDQVRQWIPEGATKVAVLTTTGMSDAALTVAADLAIDVLTHRSADEAIDAGYNLLILADEADDVASLTLIAAYTRNDAAAVMPVLDDDNEWMRIAGNVRDGMRPIRNELTEHQRTLAIDPTGTIAAMHHVLTTAANRGVRVLINGTGACAAALVADRTSHQMSKHWMLADATTHAGILAAMARLDRPALATFDINDSHLAALLAVPIVRAASLTS